jgi:hypothetical protein
LNSSERTKVLYFTSTPLAKGDNGGSIVCRYHLQRLANCEVLELHVSTFGTAEQTGDTSKFIDTLGVQYHPVVFRATRPPGNFKKKWLPAWRWPFLLEVEALTNPSVDWQFRALVDKLKPDIVIIDYVLSALFIRSIFWTPVRIVTITLNREGEFHAEMRRAGRLRPRISKSIIAEWRVSRFERWVYRNSDAVIALSRGDLPTNLGGRATAIEPILDQSRDRWRYSNSRELFFVGSVTHYPNVLAIEWLAKKFAPALAKRCPNARIRIVGTSADQVRPDWINKNIEYMGTCDEQTVTRLFTSCALFICPIENNFGAKMKVMQCAAHGTPMLATRGALSGVPFKDAIPQFSFDDAEVVAAQAADLLDSKTRLSNLSRILTCEHSRSLSSRNEPWRRLIERVAAQPLRRLSPLATFLRWRESVRSDRIDLSRRWPKSVEIGVEDPLGVTATGVYWLEEIDGERLRWTSDTAKFEMPLSQQTLPTALILRLFGIAPEGGTQMRILVNELEVFHCRVAYGEPVNQTIQLPNLAKIPKLRIRIENSGFQPPGEFRKLGVAIRSLVLVR